MLILRGTDHGLPEIYDTEAGRVIGYCNRAEARHQTYREHIEVRMDFVMLDMPRWQSESRKRPVLPPVQATAEIITKQLEYKQ